MLETRFMLRRSKSFVAARTLAFVISLGLLLAGVPVRAGVTYTHFGEQYGFDHFRQSMELYLPIETCGPSPVAIYIHGGGWLTGNAEQVVNDVDDLIARGFAVASFNYRFSQHAIYPAQIHDCKGAVRYLRANAVRLNIDPNRLAVFGDSSGGHLAALLGTTGDVASLEGEVGGNLAFSSRVQAVADIYGPTDLLACATAQFLQAEISQLIGHDINDIIANQNDPAYAPLVSLVNSANPALFCTADDPPFHIAHGLIDDVVPFTQSELLHDALVTAGVPSVLRLLPNLGHALPAAEFDLAFDFMQAQLIPPAEAADLNCDGFVNVQDLLVVIGAWGACPKGQFTCPGDLDSNAVVNVADLLLVIGNWG
jgi:acetyl esterase/lipase